MHEVGELNELMKRKPVVMTGAVDNILKETMNKESTVLRESIFRFMVEDEPRNPVYIRVWKDEILNATERDVQENYDILQKNIFCIYKEVGNDGPKIASRILALSRVNAVEVYAEPDIGTVLYKDWP